MGMMLINEAESIARIERLELEVRMLRQRIEHARTEADKRVMNRQITDLRDEITHLRHRLRV